MLAIKLKQQGGFCDDAAIASSTSVEALCDMCTCLPSSSAWMHPELNVSKLTAILLFSRTVTTAISKNKKLNKAGDEQINSPLFPHPTCGTEQSRGAALQQGRQLRAYG